MMDIEAIKARLQNATPGPWMRDKWKADIDIVRQVDWTPCGAEGHNDCMVAQTIHRADVAIIGLGHDRAIFDAEFIAHAPTDIADLLDALAAAQARAERAEEIVRLWQNRPDYYDDTWCEPGQNDLYYAWLAKMEELTSAALEVSE